MRHLIAAVLLAAAALPAHADYKFKEKPGFKDHPVISRFKGAILANAGTIRFEEVKFQVGPDKWETVEGKVSNFYYVGPLGASQREVFRGFQQALKDSRFQILYECSDTKRCASERLYQHAQTWTGGSTAFAGGYMPVTRIDSNGNYPPLYIAARLPRPQGDLTAILTIVEGPGGPHQFLQIVEATAMAQGSVTVQADALSKGLAADGKVALYGVFFDTGKAELKPESKAQLDEMAALLKKNAKLKVAIVGHTDNQGQQDANLALSQKRAEAVVAALVKTHGVDAKRLTARGVANFAPVASNASDEGRGRNRRVELVEL